jgi:hypothetical protein
MKINFTADIENSHLTVTPFQGLLIAELLENFPMHEFMTEIMRDPEFDTDYYDNLYYLWIDFRKSLLDHLDEQYALLQEDKENYVPK